MPISKVIFTDIKVIRLMNKYKRRHELSYYCSHFIHSL